MSPILDITEDIAEERLGEMHESLVCLFPLLIFNVFTFSQ